jgi:hypothetical protein
VLYSSSVPLALRVGDFGQPESPPSQTKVQGNLIPQSMTKSRLFGNRADPNVRFNQYGFCWLAFGQSPSLL